MTSRHAKLSLAQRLVLALAFLVMMLGLGNLVRGVMALRYQALLPDVPMTVSWTYLAATGFFWGVAFLACMVGLVGFFHWGRWSTLAAVTLYEVHVWTNHLLFDANDYARMVWPSNLVLTLLLLAVVWGFLNWPSTRKVFRR